MEEDLYRAAHEPIDEIIKTIKTIKFGYKNCKDCRLECVERDAPNKDNLPLSFNTMKYRGKCNPKEI